MIARATLHNQEEIERKDIRIGDKVIIEKGGDVIPKVVSVIYEQRPLSSEPWRMPTQCPICGSDVVKVVGGVAVRCSSKNCRQQILRRLVFFASKDAMDIGHLGPKVMEQLYDKELVMDFSDIYQLDAEELSQLEGFKEKSVQNLLKSIEVSKQTTLSRFILSLDIQHVGEGIADLLASHAGSVDQFLKLDEKTLLSIEGIGEKVAHSILKFLEDSNQIKEIQKLLEFGVNPKQIRLEGLKNHPFYGKTFVITGTLKDFSRSEAAEEIKKRGGIISHSVGKKTDYLLVGEEPGSKYEKARELRIHCLDEAAFKELLK